MFHFSTPWKRQKTWRNSGVFIVNFYKYSTPFSSVSIVDFEQVNVRYVISVKSKLSRSKTNFIFTTTTEYTSQPNLTESVLRW